MVSGATGLPNINITVDRRLPCSVWESGAENLRCQNQKRAKLIHNSNCLDVSTFCDSSQELAAAACLAGTRRRALRDMRSLSLSLPGLFEANLIVLAFRDAAWWVVWLRRRMVEGQWFSWLRNETLDQWLTLAGCEHQNTAEWSLGTTCIGNMLSHPGPG